MEELKYKFNWLNKLYIWSILMDPLLFFTISDRSITGVGLNLGRVLQIIFLIFFITNRLFQGKLTIEKLTSNMNYEYGLFFIFSIFSGIYGLLSGSYVMNKTFDSHTILNHYQIRPFFEFFISLYYYYYYVVLQRYMIKNHDGIQYFFKIFKFMFFSCLTIGFIDLLFDIHGVELVPRHMSDWRHVGQRFHGLAGEPRQAFVYLIFGLSVFYLNKYWLIDNSKNILFILVILIAAYYTRSASGLVGIVFGIILILMFLTRSIKKIIISMTILMILGTFIYINISFNERINVYLSGIPRTYQQLTIGRVMDGPLSMQMNNIYPVWDRWLDLINLNIIPVFFGTGYGTASILNNNKGKNMGEMANPNSHLVRSLYATGILGTFLFIIAFIKPIKRLTFLAKDRNLILLLMLLNLGSFFGHRSSSVFIFLGITIVVLLQKNRDNTRIFVHDTRH